jgi:hypothetical protein
VNDVIETATERLYRRRQIEMIVKAADSTYRNADHFVDLALRHRWHVVRTYDGRCAASTSTRTVYLPGYIDSDEEYANALHEGGHVEDVDAETRDYLCEYSGGWTWKTSFEGELEAWRRALGLAGYRWSARMNKTMETSLWAYRSHVRMRECWRASMDNLIAQGREQSRRVVRMVE